MFKHGRSVKQPPLTPTQQLSRLATTGPWSVKSSLTPLEPRTSPRGVNMARSFPAGPKATVPSIIQAAVPKKSARAVKSDLARGVVSRKLGQGVKRGVSFMGRHKKLTAGGLAGAAVAGTILNRSGRAADKPRGRPTGTYMY